MVQQKTDSKFSEYGLGSTETNLPTHDKQFPVAVKKTPLKDLQNDNRIAVPSPVGNPALLKDRGPIVNNAKVSGSKRPSHECHVSPPCPQPAASNVASGQLVYVRRKPDAELGKSNDAYCPHANLSGNQEATILPRIHVKEPNFACFPAVAPSPVSLGNPKSTKNLHWEERYQQLQLYLKKLDQSDQEEYVQTLRSISSVQLSILAVELERRSIQLSLEEAKVVQRAAVLNVLGKSTKK